MLELGDELWRGLSEFFNVKLEPLSVNDTERAAMRVVRHMQPRSRT
jgi:hypothetical protein